MLRIITRDTVAHAQHGLHLPCTVLVMEVTYTRLQLRYSSGSSERFFLRPEGLAVGLWQGSAQPPGNRDILSRMVTEKRAICRGKQPTSPFSGR